MLMVNSQNLSRNRTDRLQIPGELSTARSKLVYLTLALEGGGTAPELAARLRLGVSELYPILRVLREEGLVEREGEQFELREV